MSSLGLAPASSACSLALVLFIRAGQTSSRTRRSFHLKSWTSTHGRYVPSVRIIDLRCRRDATLKELSELVKQVVPQASARNARLGFSLAYPDKRGRYLLREVGMTFNGRRSPDETKTLDSARFDIGDYLTVEIFPDEGRRGGPDRPHDRHGERDRDHRDRMHN